MAKVRTRDWKNAKGEPKRAYVVDYTDAEGVRRTPQFEKKHQADAHLRKVQRELEDGVHVSKAAAKSFDALAEAYLRDCERRNKIGDRMSGANLRLTRYMLGSIIVPKFGKMTVTDITAKHVRDFVNVKSESHARTTVVKIVVQTRAVLQFGLQEGWLKRNVVRDDPPRIPLPLSEQREIPSLAQLRDLVTMIEGTVHGPQWLWPGMRRRMSGEGTMMAALAVYLAMTGGLRPGEVCGLQWENVDFAAGLIRVRHNMSREDGLKGPKSRAGIREVPILPMLDRYLKEHWQNSGCPTRGHVVTTIVGTPYSTNSLSINLWRPVAIGAKLLKKDGSLMGMHALRHVAASLWHRAGVSDLALKKAIGHSSISTTKDVYGHLFADDQTERHRFLASVDDVLAIPAPALDVAHR